MTPEATAAQQGLFLPQTLLPIDNTVFMLFSPGDSIFVILKPRSPPYYEQGLH